VLLLRVGVPHPWHIDRDLFSVDPNRAGIGSPSAKGILLLLSAVALSSKILDFLLKEFLCQKASHFRVMLNQMKLRVDRPVEGLVQRLGSWRLFGVGAMLRGHNRGSSSVKGFCLCAPGKNPFSVSSFN